MVVLNPAGQALIQHRTGTAPWMPLHWDLPGGWAEEDETDEAAALREVLEECSLVPNNIRELGMVAENVRAFIGYVPADSIPRALPNVDGIMEHDDFRWITKDNLDDQNLVVPARLALELVWG